MLQRLLQNIRRASPAGQRHGPNALLCGRANQKTMHLRSQTDARQRQEGRVMVAEYSICLGTAGWGVWHSPDAGESWTRHRAPFPLNSRIQALVAHPWQAQTVLAGGDTGMFISHDGGARWARITTQGDLPT